MNYSVFLIVNRREVFRNRRFGTLYLPHLQGSSFSDSLILKVEQIGSSETSVSNHLTPRDNPEEGETEFNSG
jgi:hypothetical protein